MVELAKSNHIKNFCVPFYLLIIFIGSKEDAIISLNTSIKRYATQITFPMLIITRRWLTLQRITSIFRMTESTQAGLSGNGIT
jgi:hypothetical protein